MSFNRLIFAFTIIAVLLWGKEPGAAASLQVMAIYVGVMLAVLGHILAYPAASPARRGVALLLDVSFLSWQLHAGGETVAAFFPIYLWITFGNGFRFGLPALWFATVLTTAGFTLVVATTPFWNEQMHLSTGLCVSLIILPAYSGTLIRRLSKARLEAEQASAAKTMFLANISHELRTPLSAIIGMGQMLQETTLNDEQREMTGTVEGAAKSLLALIDDILQISRLDAGRMPFEQANFDLVELVASVRQLVVAQATAKQLRIAVHITPDTPCQLVSDERRLRELLTNLVGNAVKFTATGGVLIVVSTSERTHDTAKLTFDVIDTGIGIPPDAQSRIFDTFEQADSTIVNRFGGTGLGLAISKRLAVAMGGTLEVESTVGRGSTFHLGLMVRVAAHSAMPAPPALSLQLLAGDGAAKSRLMSQLRALPASVTEFDPAREAATTPGRAPGGRPILVVATEEANWSDEQLIAKLQRFQPLFGPHVVLVCHEPPAELARLRWLCSSIVVTPASPEPLALDQLRAALHIASPRVMQPAQPPLGAEHQAMRILVAEDNIVNRRVLKAILDKAGHDVVMVDDGEEALDALEADAGRFDIVLMDVNMPRMDGLEATKLYRFMALGLPHLPIVALTADATEQMARRCDEAGIDACLTKPIQPNRLLEVIQQLARAGAPVQKTSGAVARIVDHPRFRPIVAPVLDDDLLQSLTDLGGETFVAELMEQFTQEAGSLTVKLSSIVQRKEYDATHDLVHALQSMSANMGARALVELCVSWQALSHAQLIDQGQDFANRAGVELAKIEKAFIARSASAGARIPRLGG